MGFTVRQFGCSLEKGYFTKTNETEVRVSDFNVLNIGIQVPCTVNRKFSPNFNFRETSHMRSFVKIKPSRNGKITLFFIDLGKPCLSHEFFTSLIFFKCYLLK